MPDSTVKTRIGHAIASMLEGLTGPQIPAIASLVWGSRGDRNDGVIVDGTSAGQIVFELVLGDDEIVDNSDGYNIVHKRFFAGVLVYLPESLPDGAGGQLTPDDVAGRVHQAITAVHAADATWGGLAMDTEDIGGGGAFPSGLGGSETAVMFQVDYRHLRGDLTTAA